MKIIPTNTNQLKKSETVRPPIESDIAYADYNKAQLYKERNTILNADGNSSPQPYSLWVNNSEFGRFGLGLQLYFTLIKWVIIVFLVMSALAAGACISNSTGDGLSQWKNLNNLQLLSVGNQPQLVVTVGGTADENQKNIDSFYTESINRHTLLTWLDFSYTLIFIIFVVFFGFWSRSITRLYNSTSQTPSNFAVQISGLEPFEQDPKELKHFLEQYQPIREVRFARHYSNTLLMHKEEAELHVNIQIEQMKQSKGGNSKQLDKLNQKLQEVQAKLDRVISEKVGKLTKHDQYPTLFAFVIFETIEGKEQFIRDYRQFTNLSFIDRCCLGKSIDPKHLFRGTQILKLQSQVDNPSNIKWENLEVKTTEKIWRNLVIYLAVFCLMLITFFIVFGANIVSKYNPDNCPIESYTYEETQVMIAKATSETDKDSLKNCFCLKLDVTELYNNQLTYCQEIVYMYVARQGLSIAIAFIVLIVNSLLKWLIEELSSFVRYSSLSKLLSGTMLKLFVVTFVNTALITLLLHADIFGFRLAIYVSSPIPPLQDAQYSQQFPSDLNREWYAVVGSSIINTWFVNIFSPYLVAFVTMPIIGWLRRREAENSVVQREMNKNIVGPDFLLNIHFATCLNTIFVTLFYCAGIPLMLPLGTGALLMQYWVLKYMLLRFYKKPPAFDEVLNNTVVNILPWAAVLHLLMAIWTYGEPLTFPATADTIGIEATSTGSIVIVNDDSFWIRITSSSQLSLMLIGLLLFLVLKNILIDPLSYLFGLCLKDETMVEAVANQAKYSEIYPELSLMQLATYEIRENENFQDIINAIDMQASRKNDTKEELVPLNIKDN